MPSSVLSSFYTSLGKHAHFGSLLNSGRTGVKIQTSQAVANEDVSKSKKEAIYPKMVGRKPLELISKATVQTGLSLAVLKTEDALRHPLSNTHLALDAVERVRKSLKEAIVYLELAAEELLNTAETLEPKAKVVTSAAADGSSKAPNVEPHVSLRSEAEATGSVLDQNAAYHEIFATTATADADEPKRKNAILYESLSEKRLLEVRLLPISWFINKSLL